MNQAVFESNQAPLETDERTGGAPALPGAPPVSRFADTDGYGPGRTATLCSFAGRFETVFGSYRGDHRSI